MYITILSSSWTSGLQCSTICDEQDHPCTDKYHSLLMDNDSCSSNRQQLVELTEPGEICYTAFMQLLEIGAHVRRAHAVQGLLHWGGQPWGRWAQSTHIHRTASERCFTASFSKKTVYLNKASGRILHKSCVNVLNKKSEVTSTVQSFRGHFKSLMLFLPDNFLSLVLNIWEKKMVQALADQFYPGTGKIGHVCQQKKTT